MNLKMVLMKQLIPKLQQSSPLLQLWYGSAIVNKPDRRKSSGNITKRFWDIGFESLYWLNHYQVEKDAASKLSNHSKEFNKKEVKISWSLHTIKIFNIQYWPFHTFKIFNRSWKWVRMCMWRSATAWRTASCWRSSSLLVSSSSIRS